LLLPLYRNVSVNIFGKSNEWKIVSKVKTSVRRTQNQYTSGKIGFLGVIKKTWWWKEKNLTRRELAWHAPNGLHCFKKFPCTFYIINFNLSIREVEISSFLEKLF
jgi:hypothetical protein